MIRSYKHDGYGSQWKKLAFCWYMRFRDWRALGADRYLPDRTSETLPDQGILEEGFMATFGFGGLGFGVWD